MHSTLPYWLIMSYHTEYIKSCFVSLLFNTSNNFCSGVNDSELNVLEDILGGGENGEQIDELQKELDSNASRCKSIEC